MITDLQTDYGQTATYRAHNTRTLQFVEVISGWKRCSRDQTFANADDNIYIKNYFNSRHLYHLLLKALLKCDTCICHENICVSKVCIFIDRFLMSEDAVALILHFTPTIGNFRKWLLYKCFMSLSLIVIQTNIKFLKITVTWTYIW